MDYVTAADLAVFMQNDELDPGLANISISAAQATVRGYLGQVLTLVTSDDVLLDGSGTKQLRLPERPVLQVQSVTEDGADISDYVIRRSFLIRTDRGHWHHGTANVEVIYDHGWQTPDWEVSTSDFEDGVHIPADIILVTLILARRFYDRANAGEMGVIRSETIGSYSYTLESTAGSELLPAEKAVLDNYLIEGYG